MDKFNQKIKEYAKRCGADLVGIAPIERFKNAPLRISPRGLLPTAKSVIVIAVHHPDAVIELSGEPTPHDLGPYGIQSNTMNPLLNSIAFRLAKLLEKEGYTTLPMPVTNIWRYRPYKELNIAFAPGLAHRYAAVAAGLGEIGWSGLFLSPEYGPRQRLNSIITDAPLEPDLMYEGPPLCDKCMECVKNCPTDAFRKEVKKINQIEIGGRIFKFPDTNKWRCAWAENFGLNLNLPIPERVNEKVILDTMAKYGYYAGEIGSCLRYCMPPHLRYKDPTYTRVYRRERKAIEINSVKISEKIKEIAQQGGTDWVVSNSLEEFKEKKLNIKKHLPDAESVLIIGIHYANDYTENLAQRRLNFTSYDICRYLERLGFSAICQTSLSDNLVASALNIGKIDKSQGFLTKEYGSNQIFMTILTSATLSLIRVFPCNRKKLDKKSNKRLTEDLKFLALSKGADLFGITPIRRLEEIYTSLEPKVKDEEIFEIRNKKIGVGSYLPQLQKIKQEIKTPRDYISTPTSVIVIGIHYPNVCIDRAGKPPAEAVDSYAGHAQIETVRQLGDVAFDLCSFLESMSYQAIPTLDFFNRASKVITPWGLLPDATANRYVAIAAGLGEIGWNNIVLTPEYGSRQRFVAIVTDASLEYNSLYRGSSLCKRCFKCVDACPVGAMSKEEKVSFRVEGKVFEFGKVDRLRCDWSKKYGLVGEAGPKYIGSKANILPPEKIKPEDLCEALKKIDPVQKQFLCILEKCIVACPVSKERK